MDEVSLECRVQASVPSMRQGMSLRPSTTTYVVDIPDSKDDGDKSARWGTGGEMMTVTAEVEKG